MIFNSGWTRAEIWSLTYKELVQYVEMFYDLEAEKNFQWFKAFAFYNCESTSVAFGGKPKEYLKKVLRRTLQRSENEESTIEDQFKGEDFGQQD